MISTHRNDLQESAPLLSLFFILGLWSIREDKSKFFMIILFFGALNNETILYLSSVYFFVNLDGFNLSRIYFCLRKTFFVAAPGFLAFGYVRFLNFDRPHLGGVWHFQENLNYLDQPFFLFNLIWVLAFLRFSEKPHFIRMSLLTIPFFVLPHLITGIISETRQMLPIGFIVIPSAMLYFRNSRLISESK